MVKTIIERLHRAIADIRMDLVDLKKKKVARKIAKLNKKQSALQRFWSWLKKR